MRSLRILLVLATSTGGVGTHVASLAREFAQAGHTVGVIGPSATNEQFGFDALGQVVFAPLELGTSLSVKDTASINRLRKLIATFDADIVHAHGFRAGFTTLMATNRISKRKRPHTVVSWHNQAMGSGIRELAEKAVQMYVARGADLTIGASSDLVVRARDHGARNAVFAPAAAPDPQFAEDVNNRLLRSRLLRELALPRDSVLMLAVGRIAPQKNYGLLFDALARLDDDRVHLLIAGAADEEEMRVLRKRVIAEQLPVHFLGQRDDVTTLNQAADIFVLSSLWEARALVLQEAMMAGKAIIATATGGTPELLGDAGLLITPGDAEAMAEGIRMLAAEEHMRAELGRRAAHKALDLPREPEVARTILRHYTSLLDAGSR